MELANASPFAAERFIMLDGDGIEQLLVVVKGTYDLAELREGAPKLAGEQQPLRLVDEYAGEPGASSLIGAADTALFKPEGDVVLRGHAVGRSAGDTAVVVGLRVGGWTKRVRVHGDRRWQRGVHGLVPSGADVIDAVPLTYERAFGGSDPKGAGVGVFEANPVGCGFQSKDNALRPLGELAPNIESCEAPVRHPGAEGTCVGFGPIAPHWQPRRGAAGTYDTDWQRTRMPLLPVDYDPSFAQVAPEDQRVPGYLRPGEMVVVTGTGVGPVRFALPSGGPRARVRLGDREVPAPLTCDTAEIDTDAMLLTLVWRGTVSVHGRVSELQWTRILAESEAA